MADQKLTALTRVIAPALADVLYLVDVTDATDDPAGSSRQTLVQDVLGLGIPTPNVRLACNTAGNTYPAVPVTDQVGATYIYLTSAQASNQGSYGDGTLPLWDGTRVTLFNIYNSGYPSILLSGLASGSVYDVFAYYNALGLGVSLELGPAWTNATTRATGLSVQNGLLSKSGAPTRLYVGTIVATGTGTTEDSMARRYVWSYFNQVPRPMRVAGAGSWTYASTAWRQANANTAYQLNWVSGDPSGLAQATLSAMGSNAAGATMDVGIGFDQTTAADNYVQLGGGGWPYYSTGTVSWTKYTGQGKHYAAWLEYGYASGSPSFQGNGSSLIGWIMG